MVTLRFLRAGGLALAAASSVRTLKSLITDKNLKKKEKKRKTVLHKHF